MRCGVGGSIFYAPDAGLIADINSFEDFFGWIREQECLDTDNGTTQTGLQLANLSGEMHLVRRCT